MKFDSGDCMLFEAKLFALGYRKYSQSFENADYCYWKTFDKTDNSTGYQVGFTFYDLTPFSPTGKIHVGFHFMLGNNSKIDRLDITISDQKMTVEKFEKFCEGFYQTWLQSKEELCL